MNENIIFLMDKIAAKYSTDEYIWKMNVEALEKKIAALENELKQYKEEKGV